MARFGTQAQALGAVVRRIKKADAAAGRGLSAAAKAVWERLLDPEQTSIREFLESFQIGTKAQHGASGTNMVPYRLRPAQIRLLDTVEEMWANGEAAKILVLKDRQQGISAFVESLMFERFMRAGGGSWRTVSHKDDATEDLIRTFVSFRLQVPDAVFTEVMHAKWASERPHAMEIRSGPSITRLETMTARDSAMGRGAALRGFHGSECPWWTAGLKGLGAALTSLEDSPGNFGILEFTGKDFDIVHEMCEQSRAGRSVWKLVFFDWLSNPTKTFSFPSESERIDFITTIGQKEEYGKPEEAKLLAHGASPEQILWRRREIDSPNTPGRDLRHFAREHPLVFEDAFYADSDSVFVPAEQLDQRRPRLEEQERKAERGDFHVNPTNGEGLEWVANRNGAWVIYAQPEKGKSYCWGGDACAGIKATVQGRKEADHAVMEIGDVETDEVVAVFRGQVPPEEFSIQIMCGSKWYGWSRGYPERNADGKVVMRDLPGLQDGWNCPTDIVLQQKKLTPGRDGNEWEYAPGFYTDVKTKPVLINHLRLLTRNLGPVRDGEPRLLYLGLMEEMRRYVREVRMDVKGRPTGRVSLGAVSGHDDRVMASCLRREARMWLGDRPEEQTRVQPKNERWSMGSLTKWSASELRLAPQETVNDETMGAQF